MHTKITNFNIDEAREVAKDLIDCAVYYGMVGFAANQLGINQRVCVVIPKLIILFNPKIVKVSKEKIIDTEGCFSLPGYSAQIPRHRWIEIDTEIDGKRRKSQYSGYIARIIQHEIDHLNGKTIEDIVNSGEKGAVGGYISGRV